MGKRVAALLSAAALLLSWPALAQEKIDAPAGQAWIHEGSGFGFAPTADGLKRFEVKDFGKTQSDIAITYREDATGTIVSLYLFRAAVPDVSIWADNPFAGQDQISDMRQFTAGLASRWLDGASGVELLRVRNIREAIELALA